MKRSEYETARRSFHVRRTDIAFQGKRGEQTYSATVAADVAAAEAAGVKWDPEDLAPHPHHGVGAFLKDVPGGWVILAADDWHELVLRAKLTNRAEKA